MSKLTPREREAVAGLLGTAGHAVAHWWEAEGVEAQPVQDALVVASLLGWTLGDMSGMWTIALSLCDAVAEGRD